MLLATRGVILKAIKYSETSIITDIYTEQRGLRTYIINGVRKKNAKVSQSLIQHMSLVEMIVYDRKEKNINRIKEIKPAYIYQSLPFNIYKSSVGMFMTELALKCIKEPENNQNLFDFLFDCFQFLDQTPHAVSKIHLSFMAGLTYFLGIQPEGNYSDDNPYFDLKEGVFTQVPSHQIHFLTEDLSILFNELLKHKISDIHNVPMNKMERNTLLDKMLLYYQLHLENFGEINAHKVLREVLDD